MNLLIFSWFVSGFLGAIWFTYRMRVAEYTYGDILESLLISFVGPSIIFFMLIVSLHEKLSKIPIKKN
jgi:hypothetical protein